MKPASLTCLLITRALGLELNVQSLKRSTFPCLHSLSVRSLCLHRLLTLPSPFAYIAFTVRSLCLHRSLTLPSSFAYCAFTAHFNTLRSALFVLSDLKASTVRSLCAQQSFSVYSPFRFN